MVFAKRSALLFPITILLIIWLAACQQGVEIEVTTVVTETETQSTAAGTPIIVEVTRVVIERIEVPAAPAAGFPSDEKKIDICLPQEPDTLYEHGGNMLVQTAVSHALFEDEFTTLSYDYQPVGIEKMPSLADGDALLEVVSVDAGEIVLSAEGEPVVLAEGVSVFNAEGEEVVFEGEPLLMEQLIVDFTLKPRVWADGEPVRAADSVFAFKLAADPATPASKFGIERTASYEATGELALRWTGIPGFRDATYFTNIWGPLPEHLWGDLTPAEMLEAEEVARLPVGDGPFKIRAWNPGESIVLVRNEHYYRADEGLPFLDQVTFRFIADPNALILALLSGECHIVPKEGLDVSQSPILLEAEAQGQLTPYFQTGTVYEHIDFGIDSWGDYGDDIGRPDWFEQVGVRRALTMCTDRQGMVDAILFGRSEIIHAYIPSVHPLYPLDLAEWPYDPERGRRLLDDLGFVDSDGDGVREYPGGANGEFAGEPFAVTLGTNTGNVMRQQLAQMFKGDMAACGIDVTLYFEPTSIWFADGPEGVLFGRQFDLAEFAWLTGVEPPCNLYLSSQITGPADEINPATGQPFGGWEGTSYTGWANPRFDEACQRAMASLPGTEEHTRYHAQALRIFAEEVPIMPLFLRLKVAAAQPEVRNFGVDPTQKSELYNLYEIDLEPAN